MAVFKYQTRKSTGKIAGILTAENRQEAEQTLRRRGETILKLQQVSESVEDSPFYNLKSRSLLEKRIASLKISRASQELFLRQLSALLSGGVPILTALRTIALQLPYFLSRALFCTANKLCEGHPLSEVLKSEMPFLGQIIIGMIAAGEVNGDIDRMCEHASELIARGRELRSRIIQALTYPVVVILVLIGVVAFLIYKVIPQITVFLEGRSAKLPPITQYLVDTIAFLQENGLYILIIPLGLGLIIILLKMIPATAIYVDFMMLRLPLIGKIFQSSANVLFCRILGTLLRSGINIISAMEHTENALSNRYYSNQLRYIRSLIALGHPLSTGLRVSSINRFVPLAESMVIVGEQTGRVDDGLLKVAEFSEEELSRRINFLSKLVEPALFIVVGGIVGFVYIAFFMALISASQPT